jgi:hypothetical protein
MLKLPLVAILLSAIAPTVLGHGYVESVTLNGQTYSGFLPWEDPYKNPVPDRIVRKIPDNGEPEINAEGLLLIFTPLGPVEDLSLIECDQPLSYKTCRAYRCTAYNAMGISRMAFPLPQPNSLPKSLLEAKYH